MNEILSNPNLVKTQEWTAKINAEPECAKPGQVILNSEDRTESIANGTGKIHGLATIQLDAGNIGAVLASFRPGDVYGIVNPRLVTDSDLIIAGASHLTVLGKADNEVQVRISKPVISSPDEFQQSAIQAARLVHRVKPTGGLLMVSGALRVTDQSKTINPSDPFIGCNSHGGHDNPDSRSLAILSSQQNDVLYPVISDRVVSISPSNFPNGAFILGQESGVASPFRPLARPEEIIDPSDLDLTALARTIAIASVQFATQVNSLRGSQKIASNLVSAMSDVLSGVGQIPDFNSANIMLRRAALTGL